MTTYVVTTPTYYEQCDAGVWHTEVCDAAEVKARNKREARVLALRDLKAERYFRNEHDWDCNPFGVLTVHEQEQMT